MPTLIKKYTKDISAVDESQYQQVASFKYVHKATGYAFELSLCEALSGYTKAQYSGAVLIWHFDYPQIEQNWIHEYLKERHETHSTEELFDVLDQQVTLQGARKTLVGKVCFINYSSFANSDAVQIKSAFIDDEFQQFGIASNTYRFIAERKGYVVSDNNQTPLAQKLWSNALPRIGKVEIYEQKNNNIVYTVNCNDKLDYPVWGVNSSTEDFIDLKHELVSAEVEGYKVDLDCYYILLVFSLPNDNKK